MSARIVQVRPSRNPRWRKQGAWEIFDADLCEISLCPVAINGEAFVTNTAPAEVKCWGSGFVLPDDLTNEEAIARLKQKRYRRVPVYADTPDQIAGIIDVKMFLLNPAEHYTEMLIAPSFVPETMRAIDLLKLFLTHAQGLAIVVDEFGGTEGIITMSDIVEEILSDAVPLGEASLYIEPLEKGKFLVSGNARLDDLSEHLGFELEAEGIDTIGGLVFNRLGYLPQPGARIELPLRARK